MTKQHAIEEAMPVIKNLLECGTKFEVNQYHNEIAIETEYGDYSFEITEEEE